MKKQIIASFVKNTSCLENILCTILKSENNDKDADHRMLFLDHWHMNYNDEYFDFGDKIKFFDDYMVNKLLENFRSYYGMDYNYEYQVKSFNYNDLMEMFKLHDFVILCIDAFELKNLALYKKYHVPHYVLITDVNKDGINCIDYAEELLLDIDHYNRGAIYFIYINSGAKKINPCLWALNLEKRIEIILQTKIVFNNIRKFADELNNTNKLYKELNSVLKDDVLLLRLPHNLTLIGSSRYHFNRAVQNIPNIPLTAKASENEMDIISKLWFDIIKKIIKFKFNYDTKIIFDIQKTIIMLCEKEENLAQNLLKFLKLERSNFDR